MDGNTVLLLIALMVFAGVVLVNVVIAGTVLRLEHYRTERDKAGGAVPGNAPRAANLYVSALLVSGVPLVAFFGAMLGAFSAGGWAYIAAGAASVAAIIAAVNLCAAVPASSGDPDAAGTVSEAAAEPSADEPPTLSVVTADEPATDDENNENAPEHRTPDDANG